jgi:translation initiation factor 2 subunit 1
MYFKRDGFPQESEIVICTVTKVNPHSVFVVLDEYQKTGMLHISEVSPGRIRNINDFVKDGKIIVCKVLQIDREKGHIDVSLRRVNDKEKMDKQNSIKQEQKAEKILDFVAEKLSVDPKAFYESVKSVIFKKYEYLFQAFNDFVNGTFALESLNFDDKITKLLAEIIHQRIKPPEVTVDGKIKIECYDPNGVKTVKDILAEIQAIDKNKLLIFYLGGGSYKFEAKGSDYSELETMYSKAEKVLTAHTNKLCICEISRKKD